MVSNQIRPPGFPPIQNPHANSQNNFNRGNNFNQNRGNNFNQGQIYRPPVHQPVVNQPVAHQGPAPQTHGVSKTDFERYVTANDAVLRNMQNQGQNLQSQMANLTDMLSKFVTANTASTSGFGTLPGNTVTNPKEDLKGITTRSGVTIQGPKAVNHDTEVTKDMMPPANNGSTEDVQPPVVQIQSRNPNPEPNVSPVDTPIPKASIPFPSRRNDERRTITSRLLNKRSKKTVTSSSNSNSNSQNISFVRTGKKITINGSDTAGYDKSKVECFNCHKMGHFSRECRGPRNQDNRNRNQDSLRRTMNVKETSSKAMVAIDGASFDWSFMADEEFNKSEFNLATYKRGLASVEEQLVFYKKNKVIFYDQIAVLKRDTSFKDSKIIALKSQIEKLKKEKESNQIKIDKFGNASKSLDKLIGSQTSDNSRKGVDFVMYNKACSVCGSFAHVQAHYNYHQREGNRPLLANMIAGHDENQGEPQEEPVESQPPPNASVPSTSQPTTEPHPDQELETETELHGSSSDFVHTPPTQVETSSPELKSISPEPMEHTYDQPQPSPVQQPASPEPQPTSPPKSPPLQGPTSTYVEATRINVADLLHLVPQLVTRIDNLEKELKEHKQTTAAVIVKLVKKVKKLETRVKYGNLPTRKMVLSDSESEDAANSSKQGRNLGEEDVFETPKGKDSGEADISPSGLQAAETLVQVASQKIKTYTRRVKSGLKKKLDVGVSSGDRKFKSASEEIKSGFTNISSGKDKVSQRKGKEVLEEQPQPKRSKKQIREEEASLAEIARIQAQEAAEIERKAELERLDALAAKRLNDEFEMSEQQRKRAAEVQQQAQYYTEEDWDLIRARMEANT
ncbi:ribonuclease H-like domain-containing protein [Tanacetum coccineum]